MKLPDAQEMDNALLSLTTEGAEINIERGMQIVRAIRASLIIEEFIGRNPSVSEEDYAAAVGTFANGVAIGLTIAERRASEWRRPRE